VAQRAGQRDQILVQIGQGRHSGWRGIRNAMGVSLVRTPDGLTARMVAAPTHATASHGVYCQRCGVLNHEDARFCSTCGAEQQAPPPP